ncbi:MAG: carbon storage regulator [Gammaproteobacteria bacterium]|nr:carbon storage regulator [Gammaproteobacteria bacterium]
MLVLSRRPDESIEIGPAEGIDPRMTLSELFANGPIQIILLGARPARQDGHRSPRPARHPPQDD